MGGVCWKLTRSYPGLCWDGTLDRTGMLPNAIRLGGTSTESMNLRQGWHMPFQDTPAMESHVNTNTVSNGSLFCVRSHISLEYGGPKTVEMIAKTSFVAAPVPAYACVNMRVMRPCLWA